MVQGYYGSLTKELRRMGFTYSANAKGSHEKWTDAQGRVLIVPRNLDNRHTANAILKQAGSSVRV